MGDARAVPQQVRRQRLERPVEPGARGSTGSLAAQVDELLQRAAHVARARRRDRRSARRATAAARPGACAREDAARECVAAAPSMPPYDHWVAASDQTLPLAVDEVAGERDTPAVELHEVADRADGVARRRQREHVEARRSAAAGTRRRCRRPAPIRAARSGPAGGRSRCSTLPCLPVLARPRRSESSLDRRHPDARCRPSTPRARGPATWSRWW